MQHLISYPWLNNYNIASSMPYIIVSRLGDNFKGEPTDR